MPVAPHADAGDTGRGAVGDRRTAAVARRADAFERVAGRRFVEHEDQPVAVDAVEPVARRAGASRRGGQQDGAGSGARSRRVPPAGERQQGPGRGLGGADRERRGRRGLREVDERDVVRPPVGPARMEVHSEHGVVAPAEGERHAPHGDGPGHVRGGEHRAGRDEGPRADAAEAADGREAVAERAVGGVVDVVALDDRRRAGRAGEQQEEEHRAGFRAHGASMPAKCERSMSVAARRRAREAEARGVSGASAG